MCEIYVLKLENDKYYVGRSGNANKRIEDHFGNDNSKKSAWTRKHKPISIVEVFMNCDVFDEDKYVLKYMKEYGIENVRGGSFSQIVLPDNEIATISKMLQGADDQCYNCGSNEHFVNECDSDEIKENKLTFMDCFIECFKSLTSNKPKLGKPPLHRYVCFRCGRNTHFANDCYAKHHINGKKL